MTANSDAKRTRSPIDRATIARFRLVEMMTTTFPAWPADHIEKIVYEARSNTELIQLIAHFLEELPGGIHNAAAEHVTSVIQDAWNYLPHRSLHGRCPADVMND